MFSQSILYILVPDMTSRIKRSTYIFRMYFRASSQTREHARATRVPNIVSLPLTTTAKATDSGEPQGLKYLTLPVVILVIYMYLSRLTSPLCICTAITIDICPRPEALHQSTAAGAYLISILSRMSFATAFQQPLVAPLIAIEPR